MNHEKKTDFESLSYSVSREKICYIIKSNTNLEENVWNSKIYFRDFGSIPIKYVQYHRACRQG